MRFILVMLTAIYMPCSGCIDNKPTEEFIIIKIANKEFNSHHNGIEQWQNENKEINYVDFVGVLFAIIYFRLI